MNLVEKVVLGTAQFGKDYGITNINGKLSKKKVFEILDFAWEKGIRRFDTAPDYASEKILGEFIQSCGLQNEAIVLTKIPSVETASNYKNFILSSIECSINTLGSPIEVLFFHNPKDSLLLLKDPYFFEKLIYKFPVSELGVSVYEPKEVEEISRCQFELSFQFPFNVLDRRFANVEMGKNKRYARSIFLQGLLVSKNNLRDNSPIPLQGLQREYHSTLEKFNYDPVSFSLSYVSTQSTIDYFILGVESKKQLNYILKADYSSYKESTVFDNFILKPDQTWLDPRRWNY